MINKEFLERVAEAYFDLSPDIDDYEDCCGDPGCNGGGFVSWDSLSHERKKYYCDLVEPGVEALLSMGEW